MGSPRSERAYLYTPYTTTVPVSEWQKQGYIEKLIYGLKSII